MNNIEKLMQVIPENSDCALISSDINRRYFTGMKSSAGTLLCFRDKAYLIIDFRYIEKAKKCVKNCEVILQDDLYYQVSQLLKKHNAYTVSIEAEEMTVALLNHISGKLIRFEIDSSDKLSNSIYDMRTVKSNDEIRKIENAQKITDNAFSHILEFIKEGRTEREIALELDYFMLKNGAEAISFETIALAGKNTSMPHGVPSDYIVQKGDFVLMDFGAVCDGYHSDMTRTVCVGTPTDEMKEVYDIVLSAQLNVLKNARSGIEGKTLDNFARKIISDVGYGDYFGHSLGHGVGMEIHEFPNISSKIEKIIPVNSVITVEPGIYIPDKFGIRIEDMVKITFDGCIDLTNSPKKLICL